MIVPFGLAPSDEGAVVLQAAGVGALLGSALAARLKFRNPEADVALPPIMWALALAALVGASLVGKALL